MEPFILGIAGGSGSGKTTFVELLTAKLNQKPLILSIDHYYLDRSHLTPQERGAINYDDPKAIEMDLLVKHLKAIKQNQSIDRSTYDFASHTRSKPVTIAPAKVVIVDGIFSLVDERLLSLFNLSLYVEADSDVRLARRLLRDSSERGRKPKDVVQQYQASVKPMHQKFIEPTKFKADFIIPWAEHNHRALDLIADMINSK